MPKVSTRRIGTVFLKEVEPRKWRASWTDPLTKRHIRRILPAADFKEANEQAKAINTDLASGKGFAGKLRGASGGHTVRGAVFEAIKHTGASDRTRKHYAHLYNSFSAYLDANAKGIASWSDVSEAVVENYLEYCRRSGVAHDTIRLRLHVLRLTSAYMSRTYPNSYRHVTANIRIKRHHPSRAEIEAGTSILEPEPFCKLLKWLKPNHPMVHVLAVLQGLCGLRELEAAYLRECDINTAAQTITVAESRAHKPKNRHSYREIPVCKEVARVLAEWIAVMKVHHPEGYLFFPLNEKNPDLAKSREARTGAYTPDTIKSKWSEALQLARKQENLKIPEAFVPRRLRASFVTAMRKAGADYPILQTYIGHSPTTKKSLNPRSLRMV